MWNEFEENRDKLVEWLGELEWMYIGLFIGLVNFEVFKEKLEEKEVINMCIFDS